MSQSQTQPAPEARPEVTIQPGEVVQTVAELPDQLRAEIVAAREAGATLAELKRDFGQQVHPDVIREVLPPGNARERQARERKAPAGGTVKAEATKARKAAEAAAVKDQPPVEPAAPKTPKYVTDEKVIEELASGITACRDKGVGRARLAELAGTIPMVPYRAEVLRRIQPDEVEPLRAAIAKVNADPTLGRRPAGPKQVTRAELAAKLDAVAQLLHSEWGSIKPAAVRDALADIVGAPKAPAAS